MPRRVFFSHFIIGRIDNWVFRCNSLILYYICFVRLLKATCWLDFLMGHTIRWAGRWRCWRSCRSTIITRRSWSNTVGIGSWFFFLRFVADKIDFRFAGLGGSWCGYDNIRLLFWLLDQYIDQSFLLSLRQLWYDGSSWCWWWGCLNEHNLIVFLWWRRNNWFSMNRKKVKQKSENHMENVNFKIVEIVCK